MFILWKEDNFVSHCRNFSFFFPCFFQNRKVYFLINYFVFRNTNWDNLIVDKTNIYGIGLRNQNFFVSKIEVETGKILSQNQIEAPSSNYFIIGKYVIFTQAKENKFWIFNPLLSVEPKEYLISVCFSFLFLFFLFDPFKI